MGIVTVFSLLLTLSCSPDQSQSNENGLRLTYSNMQPDTLQDHLTGSRTNAITTAVQAVSPAVVGINVTEIREFRDPFAELFRNDPWFNQFFGRRTYKQEVKGLGSGFLISPDGYILTNSHVAGNASKIIVTTTDGQKHDAEIIGADYVSDIALLKIEGNQFPHVTFGNAQKVLIGEWVIAFGNPFGLFDINEKPTVTVGVVSNTGMNFIPMEGRVYRDMIQTDAAINSGNSGGPLCNAMGEVIGVNSFIYTGTSYNTGNIGLGFAIPINRALAIVEELKEFGRIDRNFWSGLKTQTLDPVVAKYFGLEGQEGVVVVEIEKNSPADRADVRPSDIIVRINEIPIRSNQDMMIFQKDSRPGDLLQLTILRDGQTIKRDVRLERYKNER